MGAIKSYIRLGVKNLAAQEERKKAREHLELAVEQKLIKLLDAFEKGNHTVEEFAVLATDIIFANIYGQEWFYKELDQRENEFIEEEKFYSKLSIEEIQRLRPLDLVQLTKDLVNKHGIFENEK